MSSQQNLEKTLFQCCQCGEKKQAKKNGKINYRAVPGGEGKKCLQCFNKKASNSIAMAILGRQRRNKVNDVLASSSVTSQAVVSSAQLVPSVAAQAVVVSTVNDTD